MKQLLYTLALTGTLLASLAGCSTEELLTPPATPDGNPADGPTVSLTARLAPNGANTRTSHDDDDLATQGDVKVLWAPGDKIRLFSLNDSYEFNATSTEFTLTAGEATATATFEGTEPEVSMSYVALYPSTVEVVDNYFSFDMTGQTQKANAPMAHLADYDVLQTPITNDWTDLDFVGTENTPARRNALLTFRLTNLPADLGTPTKLIVGCTSDDALFQTNISVGNPTKYTTATLELGLEGYGDLSGGSLDAYLMIVPTSLQNGDKLTITVVGNKEYRYEGPAVTTIDRKQLLAGCRYIIEATPTKVESSITYTGAEEAVAFDKGDGLSATTPYLIESAGHLRTLIDETNKSGSDGYAGKYFKLATNIDIQMAGGAEWTTIGISKSLSFKGNFDGNGCTISGTLKGDAKASTDYLGFFGCINGATITNLTVNATVSGGGYVGGIVGRSDGESVISNCTNIGTVTGAYSYVGGIAGYMSVDQPTNAFITQCTNRGVVKGESSAGGCGGIVGAASDATLMACTNQGEVLKIGTSTQPCGGIAGRATFQSTIIACYNTASVSVDNEGAAVAGIVGLFENNGTLTASYNIGKITASGGPCGAINGGFSSTSTTTTISYCQYVLAGGNDNLPIYPTGKAPGTVTENAPRATFAELNVAGVASLNAGITEWNKANAASTAKHCPYHFVAGTGSGTPTLASGAPN